jgi:hypothetical protein
MSEPLKPLAPKEIAAAAAQGVVVALNARKSNPAAPKEDLVRPPHLICGIPPDLFEVAFQGPAGSYTVGAITPTRQ